jgi:hypothetical protein
MVLNCSRTEAIAKPPRSTECPSAPSSQLSGPDIFGTAQATPAVGDGKCVGEYPVVSPVASVRTGTAPPDAPGWNKAFVPETPYSPAYPGRVYVLFKKWNGYWFSRRNP